MKPRDLSAGKPGTAYIWRTIVALIVLPLAGASSPVRAQDVVVSDRTIDAAEQISSDAGLIVGPNVTIGPQGQAILSAHTSSLVAPVFVVSGGRMQIVSTLVATAREPETAEIPTALRVEGNYPNPFASTTTVQYELPWPERVRITVYDVFGRRVQTLLDRLQPAGVHTQTWNAPPALSSGAYYLRVEAGGQRSTRRMTVLR